MEGEEKEGRRDVREEIHERDRLQENRRRRRRRRRRTKRQKEIKRNGG